MSKLPIKVNGKMAVRHQKDDQVKADTFNAQMA